MFDPKKLHGSRRMRMLDSGCERFLKLAKTIGNPQQAEQAAASARLQPVKAESPSEDPPCVGRVGHGENAV